MGFCAVHTAGTLRRKGFRLCVRALEHLGSPGFLCAGSLHLDRLAMDDGAQDRTCRAGRYFHGLPSRQFDTGGCFVAG